ncbi:MAG: PVC-type heme-binding CxxCH protein [Pirellulales bacterium]
MNPTVIVRHIAVVLGICVAGVSARGAEAVAPPEVPAIAGPSDEGRLAQAGFRIPPGLEVRLFAAEPQVANPVAFTIDARGRVFVCESFRQERGVEDNRGHMDWLEDDLAAQTLEDRLAYFRKHLGDSIDQYTRQDDRIRLLEDRDGDGSADFDTVFADRFNGILDGTGAGVLVVGDHVFYTCIPSLWRLRDTTGDGKADEREELQRGFGIRVAFRGHDMHGFCRGTDGRIYFSIGDRGFNLTTREGRQFVRPYTGAVFRCQPDGSQLEEFAYGLRNPQELAFDQYGNLFTGDNNSDGGDKARWVNVVRGSDTGWRMHYQYQSDRGPWNRERLWHPQFEGQAAYIVPPIANLGDGPSGLVYYPGVGLGSAYDDHFLMCDFRGAAGQSGVRSFAVEPDGAFFKLRDSQQMIWSILGTDLAFDPQGRLMVSDWVHGWNGLGKGRLYTFTDAQHLRTDAPQLFGEAWQSQTVESLAKLLNDADMRVRLEAQFALAQRGELATLLQAASPDNPLRVRLHGIWGVGQLGQQDAQAMRGLLRLLQDPEPEVRAQTAKVLGDGKPFPEAIQPLVELLRDQQPRVQAMAALSLASYGDAQSYEPVVAMLAQHADRDPIIRHAGVMALASLSSSEPLVNLQNHESVAVRRAAVVALRRLQHPLIANYLNDAQALVRLEAARAIYDEPIAPARDALAAALSVPLPEGTAPDVADAFYRRAIFANRNAGTAEGAQRVAAFATNTAQAPELRLQAVAALKSWGAPGNVDPVLGQFHPLPPRDQQAVSVMLAPLVQQMLAAVQPAMPEVVELASLYDVAGAEERLRSIVGDDSQSSAAQAAALEAIAALQLRDWAAYVDRGLASSHPEVRLSAQRILAQKEPSQALAALVKALEQGTTAERQQAVRLLSQLNDPAAHQPLLAQLRRMTTSDPPPAAIQLDLIDAARRLTQAEPAFAELLTAYESHLPTDDPLARYRICLEGGDATRGQTIFSGRSELSCRRCHNVTGETVSVGPNLTTIGKQYARDYLLESIVAPNQKIAKGFETTIIVTADGKTLAGIVREEADDSVSLVLADGSVTRIAKAEIDERVTGKSAMPEDLLKQLSLADLRDLVEYLTTLKEPKAGDH